MSRISKRNYYLNIALEVSQRGTCLRRNFGAVIVQNDQIVSTGYTGAPRGRRNCCDIGVCKRRDLNIPSGQRYELCRSVHAEQNAIIHASRRDMIDATIYINGFGTDALPINRIIPCEMCKRMIINSGIKKVITPDGEFQVSNWVENEEIDIY